MFLRFSVDGRPITKGSTRAIARVDRSGRPFAVTLADAEGLGRWTAALRGAALRAWGARPAVDGPLRARLTFRLQPAARAAPVLPQTRPDLDKLTRAVLDALSPSKATDRKPRLPGVWRDDGQVCELVARKRWPRPGEEPGATVSVGTAWPPSALTGSAEHPDVARIATALAEAASDCHEDALSGAGAGCADCLVELARAVRRTEER